MTHAALAKAHEKLSLLALRDIMEIGGVSRILTR